MKRQVRFTAAFGDEMKTVDISAPNGGGGANYFLMIDNRYCGSILYQIGGWRVALHKPNPDFTQDDFDILIDIVISMQ